MIVPLKLPFIADISRFTSRVWAKTARIRNTHCRLVTRSCCQSSNVPSKVTWPYPSWDPWPIGNEWIKGKSIGNHGMFHDFSYEKSNVPYVSCRFMCIFPFIQLWHSHMIDANEKGWKGYLCKIIPWNMTETCQRKMCKSINIPFWESIAESGPRVNMCQKPFGSSSCERCWTNPNQFSHVVATKSRQQKQMSVYIYIIIHVYNHMSGVSFNNYDKPHPSSLNERTEPIHRGLPWQGSLA